MRSTLRIFLISALLWTLRLGYEGIAPLPGWLDSIWLIVFRPVALVLCGFLVAQHYMRLMATTSGRLFWIHSFLGGAILCLPYGPDMFASFRKAGEQNPVLLSIAFFALGIVTYGGLRGLLSLATRKFFFHKISSNFARTILLYLFFLIGEFLFFHNWNPITYFPALPLPLPSAPFVTHRPQSSESSEVTTLLLESYMDQAMRNEIFRGHGLALGLLGERLSHSVVKELRERKVSRNLTIILPETFVALEDKEDAYSLSSPVFSALKENYGIEKLAWIQGAFLADSNVVLGWQHSASVPVRGSENKSDVRILRVKNSHIPLFEVASKGISYSNMKSKFNFTEQDPLVSQDLLLEFMKKNRILICYESLYPSQWKFNQTTIVMTNHHLFTEFKLMNWVYFGFVRQMSFLFGAPAFIVSNYNPSGKLIPWSRSKNENQVVENSDWLVIPLN